MSSKIFFVGTGVLDCLFKHKFSSCIYERAKPLICLKRCLYACNNFFSLLIVFLGQSRTPVPTNRFLPS